MAVPIALLCVAAAFLCHLTWTFFVYPVFISPLSKIPSAHPLAKVTSAWIFWIRYKRQETATIHKAHEAYGPIVRLGPSEISVNCVKGGIQTVYSGGFEKGIPQGNWYHFFTNFGMSNMFSMARNKDHSARKRMMSNIYSKSTLQSSSAMTAVTATLIGDRVKSLLDGAATSGTTVNMYAILSSITMDMVTGYLFGLAASSDMITDIRRRDEFLQWYISRQAFGYWGQEWPDLHGFLDRFGYSLTPQHVYDANVKIENWALSMCDAAAISLARTENLSEKDNVSVADYPTVYSQLKSAMDKDTLKATSEKPCQATQRLEIASELLDQLAAGFDTSGITMTFLAQQLSYPHNTPITETLRREMRSLEKDATTGLPNAKTLDSASYLQAVLQEILRLHAAIPGPQPRTTPDVKGGSTLGPDGQYSGIPGGVRISAQAWSLHRNAEVFPDPESFKPERWLIGSGDDIEYSPTGDMNRWFWAFGSGGRMCVGSNLAIYTMKYIIYAIWTNFKTVIIDDSGCVPTDAYTAPPKGHRLDLRLEPVP